MIDGESFKMMVDSGASTISLPGEDAARLDLVPGPNDPTVDMILADGRTVKGHRMMLKSVRVGRFTVDDVDCS